MYIKENSYGKDWSRKLHMNFGQEDMYQLSSILEYLGVKSKDSKHIQNQHESGIYRIGHIFGTDLLEQQ